MATSAPLVNPLLFTDYSVLFVKASVEGANELSSLVICYCNAFGQKVDFSKAFVFPMSFQFKINEVKVALNVPNEPLSDKYLGMRSDFRSSKNGVFKFLKDRAWKRVKCWMEKNCQ